VPLKSSERNAIRFRSKSCSKIRAERLLRFDFRQSKYACASSARVNGEQVTDVVSADCSHRELIVLVVDVLVAIFKVLIPRVVSRVLVHSSYLHHSANCLADDCTGPLQCLLVPLVCLAVAHGQRDDQILIAQTKLPWRLSSGRAVLLFFPSLGLLTNAVGNLDNIRILAG
jgi:hypothetical protein